MGEKLSLTEAVRRYHIGEKTLRKWIRAAGLNPTGKTRNNVKQWEIDTDTLEQIIREKTTSPIPVSPVSGHLDVPSPDREQITALASELSYQGEMLEALKLEVESLKAGQASLQQELEDLRTHVTTFELASTPPTRSKRPAQRFVIEDVNYQVPASATQPAEKPPTSTRPLLPDSWSSWTPFIERHGISSERRPLRAINREDFCEHGEYMQPNQRGVGSVLVKCALSPDGMGRLLTAIRALPIGQELGQCDVQDCPCHQLLSKQETLW